MQLKNLLPHLEFLPLQLDLECTATFEHDGRTEHVIEITNAEHSRTVGYLCTGDDPVNAYLIHAANQFPNLVEALKAFLRAPSIGSNGPGSVTIEVQEFNLKAAREALAAAETIS